MPENVIVFNKKSYSVISDDQTTLSLSFLNELTFILIKAPSC